MPALLFVAFIVVPLVELYLAIQVADVIGGWWTVLVLFVISVVGATLVRREGTAAWRRFREALGAARLPATEVVDGALVILGGALLLTPGFLTDALGLLLVIPPSRHAVNRAVRSRISASFWEGTGTRRRPGPPPGLGGRPRRDVRDVRDEDVVDVEVISVERDDPPPR